LVARRKIQSVFSLDHSRRSQIVFDRRNLAAKIVVIAEDQDHVNVVGLLFIRDKTSIDEQCLGQRPAANFCDITPQVVHQRTSRRGLPKGLGDVFEPGFPRPSKTLGVPPRRSATRLFGVIADRGLKPTATFYGRSATKAKNQMSPEGSGVRISEMAVASLGSGERAGGNF
jgi:hypothetical protein